MTWASIEEHRLSWLGHLIKDAQPNGIMDVTFMILPSSQSETHRACSDCATIHTPLLPLVASQTFIVATANVIGRQGDWVMQGQCTASRDS